MKFFTLLACLFLLIGIGQAQVEISGKGTGNTITITNDNATVNGWISDSLQTLFVDDTTALKLLATVEGRVANMRGLDATNNPDKGGGWFTVVDSSDYGSILTTAIKGAEWFEHLTTDRVWVRDIYRIRGVAYLRDFGVIGDNSNDDTEEVTKAFRSGVPLTGMGGDTCKITSTVKVSDIPVHFTSSDGNYVVFISSIKDTMFLFTESMTDTVDSLVRDGRQAESFIVVSDGSQFEIGDLLKLRSDKDWYNTTTPSANQKGEMNVVASIRNDTLDLRYSLHDNYSILDGVEAVHINLAEDPQPIYLADMQFIVEDQPANSAPTLMILYKDSPFIYRCRTDSAMYLGIHIKESSNITIDKCSVFYSKRAGYGYGISVSGCTGGVVERNFCFNNRHHIDVGASSGFSIPSHDIMVRFNEGNGGGNYSTHIGAENTTYFANRVNCGETADGFVIRSEETKCINNIITGSALAHIFNLGNAPNAVIEGNVYNSSTVWDPDSIENGGSYSDTRQRQFRSFVNYQQADASGNVYDNWDKNSIIIKNNTMINANVAATGFLYIAEHDTIWNLELTGNTYSLHSEYNTGYLIYSAVNPIVLIKAKVSNNNVTVLEGSNVGFAYQVSWGDSCYYEYLDPDRITKNVSGLFSYNNYVADMDSSDSLNIGQGIMGNGEVRIDTNNVVEGICKFRFAETGAVTIEDTTGYDFFSTSSAADKFCIYANSVGGDVGPSIKNNLGANRAVRVKIEYYDP